MHPARAGCTSQRFIAADQHQGADSVTTAYDFGGKVPEPSGRHVLLAHHHHPQTLAQRRLDALELRLLPVRRGIRDAKDRR